MTRGIGDIPGGRSPLDSFILAADPENGKEGGDRVHACASLPRGFEQGRREERVIGSRFYTIYRD